MGKMMYQSYSILLISFGVFSAIILNSPIVAAGAFVASGLHAIADVIKTKSNAVSLATEKSDDH